MLLTNHFVPLTTYVFKLRLYCFEFFFIFSYLEYDISGHMIPENWEGNIRTYEHQVKYRYKMPSHAGRSDLKLCFL